MVRDPVTGGRLVGDREVTIVTSRYRVALAGPVPGSVTQLIRDRFGDVTIRRYPGRTELEGLIVDQAALRALLNLLWDMGGNVRLLWITACPPGHSS